MTEPEIVPAEADIILAEAEDAVAEALDNEADATETDAVEVVGTDEETTEEASEDPWRLKSRFLANLSIAGAEEAIGNVKRLLGLAETAALECENPKDKAEKLLDVADRWKYLLSL